MGVKTRYLQLSDTTMLEYNILGENDSYKKDKIQGFLFTELLDGHYAVFSPLECEVRGFGGAKYEKIEDENFITLNTINHLAVPMDSKDSFWYTFLDTDYLFVTDDIKNSLGESNIKVGEYINYCNNPLGSPSHGFHYGEFTNLDLSPRMDSLKLYFTSGYDFSDIFGALIRISVNRNDGKLLDLCNLFYTRNSVYKFIKYMSKPIIFGNSIYDKYLEINLLSIYDLTYGPTSLEPEAISLDVKPASPVKIQFSYIDNEDYSVTNTYYSTDTLSKYKIVADNTSCKFSRTSSIRGTIPTESLNSDNLGVYIADNPDYPYVEFYGTWKGKALDANTVQNFNRGISLYDKSLVKKSEGVYEVEEDYSPEINLKKWIAVHDITCKMYGMGNIILKEESYSMTQPFIIQGSEITKFYYRPVIFDEALAKDVTSMSLEYMMRFVNLEDNVQFTKRATLGITNVNKFYGKGTSLGFNDILPYKVYNKIVENKQEISGGQPTGIKTKYIKLYYNSTDIVLDNNGQSEMNGEYVLKLSKAPKAYKFTFKEPDNHGNMKFMDLSDGYYKLYVKDNSGKDIIIEPTYSTNMNTILGELEFSISALVINKLYNVDADKRTMSIVAYNADNSVSSMFDMKYSF